MNSLATVSKLAYSLSLISLISKYIEDISIPFLHYYNHFWRFFISSITDSFLSHFCLFLSVQYFGIFTFFDILTLTARHRKKWTEMNQKYSKWKCLKWCRNDFNVLFWNESNQSICSWELTDKNQKFWEMTQPLKNDEQSLDVAALHLNSPLNCLLRIQVQPAVGRRLQHRELQKTKNQNLQ